MLIAGDLVVELDAPVVVLARLAGTVVVVEECRAGNIWRGISAITRWATALIRAEGIILLTNGSRTNPPCRQIESWPDHKSGRIVGEIAVPFLQGRKSYEPGMGQTAAQPKARPGEEKMRFVLAIVKWGRITGPPTVPPNSFWRRIFSRCRRSRAHPACRFGGTHTGLRERRCYPTSW